MIDLIKEAKELKERQKFNDEVARLIPRWKTTGYLDGLRDDYQVEQMALILENQRLYQEVWTEGRKQDYLSLTHQIFKDFLGFELVSIFTLMGPKDYCYFPKYVYTSEIDGSKNEGGDISLHVVPEEIPAKTRKIRSVQQIELTKETLPITAKKIREEITREIISDLKNNAGTVARTILKEEAFGAAAFVKIREVSNVMHRKTLIGGANWVITSKKIAQSLIAEASYTKQFDEGDGLWLCGKLYDGIRVYVDSEFRENEILLGLYGHFLSGYAYCPYIPITPTPIINDPDFCPLPGYLTRYGKRLTRAGAKFYAKITIE